MCKSVKRFLNLTPRVLKHVFHHIMINFLSLLHFFLKPIKLSPLHFHPLYNSNNNYSQSNLASHLHESSYPPVFHFRHISF
uniref:Putative ovule protein n=1 Tax=Solanum chacoense TaxID=4108 RepID=A0A0V0I3J1_SOLCH